MKCEGKSYSIKHWYDCLKGNCNVSKREVEFFVNESMRKLSDFPQSSFDDFMKKIAFLINAIKARPDFYNPNNFLIDYENKKINIVDVFVDNHPGVSREYYDPLGKYQYLKDSFSDSTFSYLVGKNTSQKHDEYSKIILEKIDRAYAKYSACFSCESIRTL